MDRIYNTASIPGREMIRKGIGWIRSMEKTISTFVETEGQQRGLSYIRVSESPSFVGASAGDSNRRISLLF